MEGFSDLIELSIALAGFTSIVVVFAHKDEKWNPLDKFRITNALMTSLGSTFLAALPAGLLYIGVTENQIWRIECLVVSSYFFVFLTSIVIRRKNLAKKYRDQLPHRTIWTILTINYLFTLFMFSAFFGWISIELKALSYFGIVIMLLLTVFAFSRLLFFRPIDSADQ